MAPRGHTAPSSTFFSVVGRWAPPCFYIIPFRPALLLPTSLLTSFLLSIMSSVLLSLRYGILLFRFAIFSLCRQHCSNQQKNGRRNINGDSYNTDYNNAIGWGLVRVLKIKFSFVVPPLHTPDLSLQKREKRGNTNNQGITKRIIF